MISPVRLTPRQVSVALPSALLALGTVMALVLFLAMRGQGESGPRLSGFSEWAFIAGSGVAGWLAATRLRRTTPGLQVVLAWGAGLTVVGVLLVATGAGPLAADLVSPPSTAVEVGRWALLAALGPLAAAWSLDYRRSDAWYVAGFAAVAIAWLAFALPLVAVLDEAF